MRIHYLCTPDSVQYYRGRYHDFAILAIWRMVRRQGLAFCAISFPFLLLRKALRWRFRAFHGTRRPNELPPIVDPKSLAQARRDFSVYESTCLEYGMEHVRTFRPPWIGGKSGVFAAWLHPAGEFYCNHHSHRHSTWHPASQSDCLLVPHQF